MGYRRGGQQTGLILGRGSQDIAYLAVHAPFGAGIDIWLPRRLGIKPVALICHTISVDLDKGFLTTTRSRAEVMEMNAHERHS